MDDGSVAKADMHRRGAFNAFERLIERSQSVRTRLLRTRLHVWLIDLHYVRTGCEQIPDLRIHRRGIVHRRVLATATVVIDLRLLRHGEGSRDGCLYVSARMPAQKLKIAHAHGVLSANGTDHARHRIGVPAAIESHARIIQVDPIERGGEAIRIALAADLPIGNDIEPGVFLRLDGHQRGIVLRLRQIRLRYAPQLECPHPRREAPGEPLAVDKPLRLRIASDKRRGQQHHFLLLPRFRHELPRPQASAPRAPGRRGWQRHAHPAAARH